MEVISVGDALSIFDNVKDRVKVVTNQTKHKDVNLDYAYITSTLVAVGKLSDENVNELSKLVKDKSTMVWNLSGRPFTSRSKNLLQNRVVEAVWATPGQFTHLPTLSCVLSLCYSLKSWLDISPDNIAVITCGNGKSRTGILIACLLRYIKAFSNTEKAFSYFNQARLGTTISSMPILAPSYRQFFDNIDHCMDSTGDDTIPKRLHLKSVQVQGLPVDDKPCVEILTSDGIVFSSYPVNGVSLNRRESIWHSEFGDGIFRIGMDLVGDFSVICRFGGQHLSVRDHTTLIFKYQHNTAFINGEIILKRDNIDVNPQYSESIDLDLFVVRLIFGNVAVDSNNSNQFNDAARFSTAYYKPGKAAFEAGLDELSKRSNLIPDPQKTKELMSMGYSSQFIPVALQLSNNSVKNAADLLDKMDARAADLTDHLRSRRLSAPETLGLSSNTSSTTLSSENNFFTEDVDDSNEDTRNRRNSLAVTVDTQPSRSDKFSSLAQRNSQTHSDSFVMNSSSSGREYQPFGAGNSSNLQHQTRSSNQESIRSNDVFTPPESALCAVCGDNTTSKRDQLVPCSSCHRYFHTFCFGGRRVPFTMITEEDKKAREKYLAKHYGNWRCSTCPPVTNSYSGLGKSSLLGRGLGNNVLEDRGDNRSSRNSKLDISALKNAGYGMGGRVGNRGNIDRLTENDSPTNKASTQQLSAHDQIAILLGILSASGISIDSLLAMSEDEQRETIIQATKNRNRLAKNKSTEGADGVDDEEESAIEDVVDNIPSFPRSSSNITDHTRSLKGSHGGHLGGALNQTLSDDMVNGSNNNYNNPSRGLDASGGQEPVAKRPGGFASLLNSNGTSTNNESSFGSGRNVVGQRELMQQPSSGGSARFGLGSSLRNSGVGNGSASGFGPGNGPGSDYGPGNGSGSGYGPGNGPGAGYGQGHGPVSGFGSGNGPGAGYGPGNGSGSGSGFGPGNGPGSGYGPGNGPGSGFGHGNSPGTGYGPGNGSGSRFGPGAGYGPGDGIGFGSGNGPGAGYGPGNGPGAGYGPGSGYGPGNGSGSGFGPGNGPGAGYGPGNGSGPGFGPGNGPGSGPGFGSGNGPGSSPGFGSGNGPGSGPGFGPGNGPGSGYGPGNGSGPGFGPGNGPDAGYGPGSGPGFGPGAGYGPGNGSGPGFGPGNGPGAGYGPGYGSGSGPGFGPGAGSGPGNGLGAGYGPGNGPGSGFGPGNGLSSAHGPGNGPSSSSQRTNDINQKGDRGARVGFNFADSAPSQDRKPSARYSERISPTSSLRATSIRGFTSSGANEDETGLGDDSDTDDDNPIRLGVPLPSKQKIMAMLARKRSRDKGQESSNQKGDNQEAPAEVKLKDDPVYGRYVRMVQIGLQKTQVAQKMLHDGVVPTVEQALSLLSMNPDSFIPRRDGNGGTGGMGAEGQQEKGKEDQIKDEKKIQPSAENKDDKPQEEEDKTKIAVKDHPVYSKYFNMLNNGVPKEVVIAKMTEDGVDAKKLDLDPNTKVPIEEAKDGMVAIKDHPKYEKWFKMLKFGAPAEAVKAKMQQEGIDPSKLDLDPNTKIPLDDSNSDLVAIKDHPKYAKFFKMLKFGAPAEGVKAKMQQEGLDPSKLDLDPDTKVPLEDKPKSGEMVAAQDHPKYSKYFKMLKVGLPKDAIKAKMIQEKANPDIIDKDPTELIPLDDSKKIAIKDHPKYSKYFKMLKVGLPKESVKAKMKQEGVNPDMLDKDPDELIPEEEEEEQTDKKPANLLAGKLKLPMKSKGDEKPKSNIRKKKLFWKGLDASKITADSLWYGQDLDIDLDEQEFNELFVDITDESEKKKKKAVTTAPTKKKVILIDPKRAQNAGIALARIKIPFEELRTKISIMDDSDLTTEQLQNLQEYLPNPDEIKVLKAYTGDKELLGTAEKYMLIIMDLPTASNRIECMKYKQQFLSRFFDLQQTAKKILNACDEVKSSIRLKRVLKTILKVGNQMNEGESNVGFSLDSLLKLQSQKAFDNKTTILDYVINLIYRNDRSALDFPQDLPTCEFAARLHLDTVQTERTALRNGMENCLNVLSQLTEIDQNNATIASLKQRSEGITPTTNMLPTAKISEFFDKAKLLLGELDKSIEERVKPKYSSLLTYFGEDPGMASCEFFFTLSKFMNEFKKAREAFERQKKVEEKKKQAAAKKEMMDAAKKAKAAAAAQASSKETKKDDASESPLPNSQRNS